MKKLTFILILLSMVCTFGQGYMYIWKNNAIVDSQAISNDLKISFKTSSVFPTENLVAYYPLNGNANDFSGNNLHGSNSGVTWTTDRWNQPNKAAFFGASSVPTIIAPDNALLDLTNDFALSFWIKPTDNIGTKIILSKHTRNVSYDGSWFIAMNNSNVQLTSWTSTVNYATDNTSISVNNFTHVIFNYRKSDNRWSYYINGSLTSSGNVVFGIANTSHNFLIGNESSPQSTNNFRGSIDDIRIYSRYLSDSEIQALYNESQN